MRELSLDLGHMKVAARCCGDANSKPVLALHGWLDNAASFDFLAPMLEDHYVVALDLPGHGQSDHIADGMNYHLTDAVANVVRVLDMLNWQRVTLLGHSMGAAIASLVAGSCQERVERLVLIDAIGPLSERIANGPERLGQAVTKLLAAGRKSRTLYSDLHSMAQYRANTGGLSVDAAMHLVERGAKPIEGGYSWGFDPRLLLPSLMYFSEEQVATFLQAIQAPTLLITGSNGLMVDNPVLDQRIAEVSTIVHTSIDGHHHLHMDSAKRVADAINSFLA